MVLRAKKSFSKLSGLFNAAAPKSNTAIASHLIWVLLPFANKGPQHANRPSAAVAVDELVKTLRSQSGVHSTTKLNNTSPSYFGASTAISARASSLSLLIRVYGEERLSAVLEVVGSLLKAADSPSIGNGNASLRSNISMYKLVQQYEPRRSRELSGRCTVAVSIEPSVGQDTDIDSWYREEHLHMLASNSIFLRCNRYERLPGPDGMATGAKFLALHEYTSVEDLLNHSIQKGQLIEETAWTRRVFDDAKSVERTIWTVPGLAAASG